jgi:hypothetical protein
MKPKEQTKKPLNKLIIVFVIVVGIGAVGWLVYSWWKTTTVNYAQEVAKPLEDALVKAGARKVCSNGDAGQGVDNRTPWLQDLYYYTGEKTQAEQLAQRVASENGYSLQHASKENRGPINVADEFIDMWYYDHSSKKSSYSQLSNGNIEIAFIIDSSGKGYVCDNASLPNSTTVIGIDVRMPDFKQR